MYDIRFLERKTLEGIDAAHLAGLGLVTINVVVKRGQHDDDIVALTTHFTGSPSIVRSSNTWMLAVPTVSGSATGNDLRARMRGGFTDDELSVPLVQVWIARTDRYSELRGVQTPGLVPAATRKVETS